MQWKQLSSRAVFIKDISKKKIVTSQEVKIEKQIHPKSTTKECQ